MLQSPCTHTHAHRGWPTTTRTSSSGSAAARPSTSPTSSARWAGTLFQQSLSLLINFTPFLIPTVPYPSSAYLKLGVRHGAHDGRGGQPVAAGAELRLGALFGGQVPRPLHPHRHRCVVVVVVVVDFDRLVWFGWGEGLVTLDLCASASTPTCLPPFLNHHNHQARRRRRGRSGSS